MQKHISRRIQPHEVSEAEGLHDADNVRVSFSVRRPQPVYLFRDPGASLCGATAEIVWRPRLQNQGDFVATTEGASKGCERRFWILACVPLTNEEDDLVVWRDTVLR
jgi:hypothetical protein